MIASLCQSCRISNTRVSGEKSPSGLGWHSFASPTVAKKRRRRNGKVTACGRHSVTTAREKFKDDDGAEGGNRTLTGD